MARRADRSGGEAGRRWSGEVTRNSHALDLDQGVFTWDDPARIARSLKLSAERSARRKAGAYGSAMSMLTFYVNRAGAKLPEGQKQVLAKAKDKLREAFGRPPKGE